MSFLVVSLDFELLWGLFDKVRLENKGAYFSNTRKVIPQMLRAFEQYGVAVSWATVGMLLTESKEEWEYYKPQVLPSYQNPKNSPYHWVERHGYFPQFHSALPLVQHILQTPGQELASHTYSHYYTMEGGQDQEQFRKDLQMARKIVKDKVDMNVQSLVFPRNQYNANYLKVCSEEGFSNVRTNPGDWFWKNPQSAGFVQKAFRAADTLLPMGKSTSFTLDSIKLNDGFPIQIPASRFYRPHNGQYKSLDRVRMKRVIQEMTYAANNNLIYHLWWHPHNFGNHPEENMKDLLIVLQAFEKLRNEKGMQSVNMGQLAEMLMELAS
ncbi:polysaccharide deacetylase family protein [Echinicola sediminis]